MPPYSSGMKTPFMPRLLRSSTFSQGNSSDWSYSSARGAIFSTATFGRGRRTRPRSVERARWSSRSNRAVTGVALCSVDGDGLAGEEPAVGGEDGDHEPGDLVGGADPSDRDAAFESGPVVGVGEVLLVETGLDVAGREIDDGDPGGRPFDGQRARDAGQCGLGGGVGQAARHAEVGVERADEGDEPAGPGEMRPDELGDPNRRDQVRLQHGPQVVHRQVGAGTELLEPGAMDDAGQPATGSRRTRRSPSPTQHGR